MKLGKPLKYGLLAIIVVAAVFFLWLNFYLGASIKAVVEQVGPKAIGAPLTVDSVKLRLLRGFAEIQGVTVGNPAGYKTPAAVKVGLIRVELAPMSLLSDTLHIREIRVEAPEITYEIAMDGSNIGQIQKNVAAFTGAGQAKPEAKPAAEAKPAEPKKPGKKVLIDHFLVTGGTINVSATFMAGKVVPVPLPTVELRDIGKEKETSMADATTEMFNAVFDSISKAATTAVGSLGDAGKAAGRAAANAGKAVTEGAGKLLDSAKGLFSK
ncbi:MAG: AsmA family protein [Lentisphaeria bacterium]